MHRSRVGCRRRGLHPLGQLLLPKGPGSCQCATSISMRPLLVLPRARLLGLRRGAPSPRILRPLPHPPQLAPHQHHAPVQLHLQLLRQVLRLRVRLSARVLSVP